MLLGLGCRGITPTLANEVEHGIATGTVKRPRRIFNGDTLPFWPPSNPRSPGTHIVGPWVTDSIKLQRDLRRGTQNIGNWASRERFNDEIDGISRVIAELCL